MAAGEQALEPLVNARAAEPLLHQGVETECRQVPLVEHDGVAESDRAGVIGLGPDDVEQPLRALAITTVPVCKRLAVQCCRYYRHVSTSRTQVGASAPPLPIQSRLPTAAQART